MILKNHNLVQADFYNYRFFTANSIVKANGELVMGAGIAKQVARRYPDLPAILGKAISIRKNKREYVVLWGDYPFIPLQTKRHWRDPADLKLIVEGLEQIRVRAMRESQNTFALNMLGVGLGGLKLEVVLPYVALLPDNVYVYVNYPFML